MRLWISMRLKEGDDYGYGDAEFRFRDDGYCVEDVKGGNC